MRAVRVTVKHGGNLWVCRYDGDCWKCGQCGRGLLPAKKKDRCRVCRAVVVEVATPPKDGG